MADFKFELYLPGLNALMTSPEVQALLDEAGETVAGLAGKDYATSPKTGRWVGFCNVFPNSRRAAHENFSDNTLLKALGASGLRTKK